MPVEGFFPEVPADAAGDVLGDDFGFAVGEHAGLRRARPFSSGMTVLSPIA
ncbi:MAG: hypothetical protein IPN07_12735 [Dehalococcoidia bacterium]|nr:hypothetical protein [Dehalococcoidia bacterium]